MRWRFWQKEQEDDDTSRMDWQPSGPTAVWQEGFSPAPTNSSSTWTTKQYAQASLAFAALFGLRTGYKRYFRRVPNIDHLKPDVYRRRSMYGYVTKVGDGDGFRFYHTPGGRLMGWGWLPGRKPPYLEKGEKAADHTLSVRVAGVDAPECAHWGKPEQPFAKDAMAWLQDRVEGRYVRVWPLRRDQNHRIISTVRLRLPWRIRRSDLGLAMIQSGYSEAYKAKTGSEFGGMEDEYVEAEQEARRKKIGMWQTKRTIFGKTKEVETPREYKNRMNKEAAGK